jgi:hypothetical protein
MWRPIKLLLSDWWPQLQKRRTDENLSRMQARSRGFPDKLRWG